MRALSILSLKVSDVDKNPQKPKGEDTLTGDGNEINQTPSAPDSRPLLTISIPAFGSKNEEPLTLSLASGDRVFVLGGNGVGKSSLMQLLYRQRGSASVIRVPAYRQVWFNTGQIAITPAQRSKRGDHKAHQEATEEARYVDHTSGRQILEYLFDLVAREADANARVADLVRGNDIAQAKEKGDEETPIITLNRILRDANLGVEIEGRFSDGVRARRRGSPPFDAAQLSDGQRAALLIAATVLTADLQSIILIDEPERHLHRSISAPLLRDLFAERPDCAIIVSTHDIDLAADHPTARALLLRDYQQAAMQDGLEAWDYDLLPSSGALPDDLRADVLGARRQIVFVEGDSDRSLDHDLYRALLPDVSVIPKGSCRHVIEAVRGVRATDGEHWIEAFGLIDRDGRSSDVAATLSEDGVHVLSVNAVKSIYYHPAIIRLMAQRSAAFGGGDAEEMINNAQAEALEAITANPDDMCAQAVEHQIREKIMAAIPTAKDILTLTAAAPSWNVEEMMNNERTLLQAAKNQNDLLTLVQRYRIKRSAAPNRIAVALKLRGRDDYEQAVRHLLREDASALGTARALLGGLWEGMCSKLAAG